MIEVTELSLETITKEPLIEEIHVLTQPTRLKIINVLREAGEPLYIEQIAKRIKGVDRRSVSFHLATLAEYGFVKGEYREIETSRSRGKAAKFYELTEKVDQTFRAFKTYTEK